MNKKERESFPGDQTGMIQILIKPTELEESVQLRFEFDFNDSTSSS